MTRTVVRCPTSISLVPSDFSSVTKTRKDKMGLVTEPHKESLSCPSSPSMVYVQVDWSLAMICISFFDSSDLKYAFGGGICIH
ncbi:hypothetical protein TNIN_420551 [Trichonephila inaurata madagascariensis]|uniref:Uncharacterized protein n=1 Tax=Trichonephila inaurata madagascariensis TaxID=2747483 RepID=A0A8X7CK69_9ARAC|nr:hypothetical protein TNIN_420551 [Trichonephila inaurata madagascariensis]